MEYKICIVSLLCKGSIAFCLSPQNDDKSETKCYRSSNEETGRQFCRGEIK